MKTSEFYSIIKYNNGKMVDNPDDIAVEYSLDVYVNGQKFVRLLCTPKSLKSLCLGFLRSEGIIESDGDVESFHFDEEECSAFIETRKDDKIFGIEEKKLNVVGTSKGMVSEDIYGKNFKQTENEADNIARDVDFKKLLETVERFGQMSELFKNTGCAHSCGAGSVGNIEVFEDDIGRHNALDKVVGSCMLRGIDTSKVILFLSGRVSSEMLLKALGGGFRAVVSRSAPTNAAVDIARKNGIFLCGFAREDKINIYSGFPS
ncbi:formate dehydrogenase accessory sulfurtransferase FdhD [Peptoclostridium litorale]|nr:formate dehydrogenase accessory sulfurtransferase FdhD [Peptoclostridium litorale]